MGLNASRKGFNDSIYDTQEQLYPFPVNYLYFWLSPTKAKNFRLDSFPATEFFFVIGDGNSYECEGLCASVLYSVNVFLDSSVSPSVICDQVS